MNKDALIDTLIARLRECEDSLMAVSANLEDLGILLKALKIPERRPPKKKVCEVCSGTTGWYAPGLHRGEPERWIPCKHCSRKGKKKVVKRAAR